MFPKKSLLSYHVSVVYGVTRQRSPLTYASARKSSLFSVSHLLWHQDVYHALHLVLFVLYQRHSTCAISCFGFSGRFSTSTIMMLAFLSFVCAVCLAVFISAQRIRTSVPRLSIILWLFGYNLVHGINALVWSGNVDIHVPVWCDIGEI